MAKFISISGPASTGKTTLFNYLRTREELKGIVFIPDIYDIVWEELVDKGYFTQYEEIVTDSDFLCTFIMHVVDRYNSLLSKLKETDSIIIIDKCWVDLSIYTILNMWYTRVIKEVQEEILSKICLYNEDFCKIYMTKFDESLYPEHMIRNREKMINFKMNKSLERQYYDIASHIRTVHELPSSDIIEASAFIIEDLRNLGYVK